jgi:RNA polymerase sigma-70 factor, ECF subfamily
LDENSADAQIRAALAQNDPAAVELIWNRYAGDLLAFLAARLGSKDDAEDVLQALFVTIVRKRQILAQARCLAAYLYRMTRNEATTYIRSHQRHRRDAADTEPWLVPRDIGDQPYDLAEQLQVTLSRLPLAQREVVVLKVYREKTFGEIAQLLGVSPNTAASRYRYGMERLRSLLKDNAS